MRRLQTLRRLDGDIERVLQCERSGLDFRFEALTLDEGHHNEGLAFDLIDFMNRADVGVVEGRRRFGFPSEAGPYFRVIQ